MINLLPTYERRRMESLHTARVIGVSLLFVGGLCIAALALLTPSFVYVWLQERDLQGRMAALDLAFTNTKEAAPVSVIEDLARTIQQIDDFEKETEITPVLDAVLGAKSAGIRITAFTIERASESPVVLINGIAASRDALQKFAQDLRAIPVLSNVDLPVSNLTAASNSSFNISARLVEDGDDASAQLQP